MPAARSLNQLPIFANTRPFISVPTNAYSNSQYSRSALAGYQPLLSRQVAPGSYMQAKTALRSKSICAASASSPTPVAVGLIGYGLIGKELVEQIRAAKESLQARKGLDISVAAVADIPDMFLGVDGDMDAAAKFVAKKDGVPSDLKKFGEWMAKQPGKKVIVDCTASDFPPKLYAGFLEAGINIATPNKKLGSGPLAQYKSTFEAAKKGGSRFFYEASVGAGLPITNTLQDLLDAGDEIETIEGIFSGTLSYLFNVGGGQPFSAVVQDAAEKGFTEPDPRDDLSGLDVQRKALILARECGLDLELDDIPVESLVPEPLQSWEPTDDEKKEGIAKVFIEKMKPFDGDMAKRMEEAAAAGDVLRYVATIDVKAKKASVSLQRFPSTSPFAATQYADNIVSFNTKWYTPRPLVVQGPGAGAAVTAGGVFADVLTAAQQC
eukprot:gnl/MRDRNA2_/MRDRNA2_162149_c0_seq1.p1 gnl/MRDRNA2_/MRDRNA2_162149_c0~~gnl/MRDRNA2_/MRDRNA2_162149_c0_seq1.p1  ORF type:complete len:486 (+),score=109.25 gnl/MRDRNA2_/MRDRNA2_162149_c0_seq1:150-1460(+)